MGKNPLRCLDCLGKFGVPVQDLRCIVCSGWFRVRELLLSDRFPATGGEVVQPFIRQTSETIEELGLGSFNFRPYSLRRGGATFWFAKHGSLDRLLLQGRWQAPKTARIYIN